VKCPRCSGLMVYQVFYSGDDHFPGWKCIACGEIVDPVILENRKWAKTARQSGGKPETALPSLIESES
jgi:hypothetical protein